MSATPEAAAEQTGAPARAAVPCPQCSAEVAAEQDWCLACGAPARTRVAPAANWRLPLALIATIALIAGLAIAVAFVALTDDDPVIAGTQPATTAGATTPAPAAPASTATAGATPGG